MDETMRTLWARLEKWLKTHASDLYEELEPQAFEWDIVEVEKALDLTFPADLTASLYLHNGGESGNALIGNWELFSTKEILEAAYSMQELVDAGSFGNNDNVASSQVKGYWWNPRWIPFAASGSGHYLCLDTDPAPEGTPGQVLLFLHDQPQRLILAASFREWLGQVVEDLEKGLHSRVYDKDLDMWEFTHPAFLRIFGPEET